MLQSFVNQNAHVYIRQ